VAEQQEAAGSWFGGWNKGAAASSESTAPSTAGFFFCRFFLRVCNFDNSAASSEGAALSTAGFAIVLWFCFILSTRCVHGWNKSPAASSESTAPSTAGFFFFFDDVYCVFVVSIKVLLRRLRVLGLPRQILFLLLFLLVLSFHNKSSPASSESDAAYTADLFFFSFVMVCVRRVCGWNITACQCFVSNCSVLCRLVCFAECLWFGKPKKKWIFPVGRFSQPTLDIT